MDTRVIDGGRAVGGDTAVPFFFLEASFLYLGFTHSFLFFICVNSFAGSRG